MVPNAKRQSRQSIRPAASRLALILIAAAFALPAAAQDRPHSEWTTLGTGGGPVPSPTQAQPANLLHYADQFILVDAGDGTLEQLVKAKIPLGALRTVFISHMHFDHTSGLFAVLGNRYMVGAPPLTVYGPVGTKKLIDGLVAAMQPYVDLGPGGMPGPQLSLKGYVTVVEIPDGGSVRVGAIKVTAVRNTHYSTPKESPEYRYPSFAYRFDLPDRSIAYTGDTGPSPAVEKLAVGADLLVSEIGDPDFALGELKAHGVTLNAGIIHHFTAEHLSPANVGLLAGHAGVKHLVLTHSGLRPGSQEEIKAKVAANFTGTVVIAKDLDRF
jgi:ribonuclease BN (tRNA processing enzyme)